MGNNLERQARDFVTKNGVSATRAAAAKLDEASHTSSGNDQQRLVSRALDAAADEASQRSS